MGIVYAAFDDELDRKVAIKLVRGERVDELVRARVLREAQAMAKLSHPNVVQIYDVGVHEGLVYVAMEFVAGPTLATWTAMVTERARVKGTLAWPELLARYIEAGRGLAAAHAANLVHRDFKPVNAIVGDDGRVRVLDFGIARPIIVPSPVLREPIGLATGPLRLVEAEPPQSSIQTSPMSSAASTLTKTGAMVGTPAYMSPEQFEGGSIDARSDQFGFCVALWEALHGERPFAGGSPGALLLATREGAIRSPSTSAGVPSWLRERIRRGLAYEPSERWPSIDALLDALLDDPDQRRRVRFRRLALAGVGVTLLAASLTFAHEQMIEAELAEAEATLALAEEAQAQRKALEAEAARDRALADAQASASRARDTARILAARSLVRDPTLAAALLREVEDLDAPGWRSAALEILRRPISRVVLAVHDDRVVDVEYSPDGAWLATASFDGRVRMWSSAALVPDRYYEFEVGDRVFDLDFDPHSERLVAGARNRAAWLALLPSEPPTRAAQPLEFAAALRGEDIMWTARFSPTGDRVVTASRTGEVTIWPSEGEAREPTALATISVGPTIAWHAEFSPRGDAVAIATEDGRVLLWTPASGLLRELHRYAGEAWVAHFSPDGRFVASASQTGELHVAPVEREGEGELLRGHTGPVQRIRWSPDGHHLASCSHDRSARVWPIDAEGRLAGPVRTISIGTTFALSPAFSPDSRWLAIGSADPIVRVLDLAGGLPIELRGHLSDVFALRFSPDGRQLVTSSHDRSIRIWDVAWSRVERDFTSTLALAGRWWIDHDAELGARVWEARAGEVVPRARVRAELESGSTVVGVLDGPEPWIVAPGVGDELLGLALSDAGHDELVPRWRVPDLVKSVSVQLDPGGRWLASISAKELRLWHFADGFGGVASPRVVEHELAFDSAWALIGIAPSGRLLVAASTRGEVLLVELDPERGTLGPVHVQPRNMLSGRANALVFDPDQQFFVLTALDRSVRVWREGALDQPDLELGLRSEARSAILDRRADASGDSGHARLLFGSSDGVLRSFDPRDGAVADRQRLEGTPLGLAMAPGRLAAGTTEGEVSIFEGTAERVVLPMRGGVHRLALTEGGHVVAATNTGVLQVVWLGESLASEHLLARLDAATSHCPSARERIELAGEAPELAARGCE